MTPLPPPHDYAPVPHKRRDVPRAPKRSTRKAGEPYPEPRLRLTAEDKDDMRDWRRLGYSAVSIARAYKVTVDTVYRALREVVK